MIDFPYGTDVDNGGVVFKTVKEWVYRDCVCRVVSANFKVIDSTYYNGYCACADERVLFIPALTILKAVDVHGGITFDELFAGGVRVFGFDTMHAWGREKQEDMDWLVMEVQSMCDGVLKIVGGGGDDSA